MSLGEFDLIAKYFSPQAKRAVLGIGDDCALMVPTPGQQWAISSDMLVEGRHFLSTVDPLRLGHKSLAVNLSDLAACGAAPVAFTLALALPRVDENFLDGFSRGLLALAGHHDCELIGGDTTAGPLSVCITVFGEVPPGQALRRDGAREGDDLWVSGRIGDARLALEAFRGRVALEREAFESARAAMELPQPRVALGLALRGVATSAIDLSDGLLGDLQHILKRSNVGATVELDALPRSAMLSEQPPDLQQECLLSGGDDYELLFTAPPAARAAVENAARSANTAITRIGHIEGRAGMRVLDNHGHPVAHGFRSFDHFRS